MAIVVGLSTLRGLSSGWLRSCQLVRVADRQYAQSAGDVVLSPAVQQLVTRWQLDHRSIPATGPRGRLLKGDVLNFLASRGSSPTPAPAPTLSPRPAATATATAAAAAGAAAPLGALFTDVPLTNVRKIIAGRLSESKRTIPHAYVEKKVTIEPVLALRREVNAELARRNEKPTSLNDWIVKAVAVALVRVPGVNVTRDPATGNVVGHASPSISVAVAIPDGLITPIVHDAAAKSVAAIGAEVRLLADKAKNGKLLPHEFQGGTFTVSNLGMFGIASFSAVINPPQTAILAVGGSVPRVVLDEATKKPRQTQTVSLSLSYDSRAIDEETAASFLQTLDAILENPLSGLL